MTTRRHALQLALGASASSLIASRARALSGLIAQSSNAVPISTPVGDTPSMQWWEDAKFGLFMHWGLYSVAAGEWKGRPAKGAEHFMLYERIPLKEYAGLAKGLTLEHYDPDAWCKAAKQAGMKYLVITAKHHEGFAMFDSPSSSYNIVKMSPYGKDPMKPLAAACAKYGLKFCFYYSLGRDWEDPDVPTNWPVPGGRSNTWDYPDEGAKQISRYFERKVKPQVRELLTQYGPIGVMWFDTPELITPAESAELRALIHQLQPNCIINDRIGNGQGDFEVAEQKLVRQQHSRPWESNITMSKNWGYIKTDRTYKTPEVLVRDLIEVVSAGGNFLLDIGPTAQGTFTPEASYNLKKIGDWMAVNGEGIYGTREWTVTGENVIQPVAKTDGESAQKGTDVSVPKDAVNDSTSLSTISDLRFTSKGKDVYIFARSWRAPNVRVKSLSLSRGRVAEVALLGTAERPEWRQGEADLFVSLSDAPKTEVPVYAICASLSHL